MEVQEKLLGGARREHFDELLLHRLLGRGFDHQHLTINTSLLSTGLI